MSEQRQDEPTPPGEGERRAVRGLISQYDYAARAIYAALASRRLQWIGLADRKAGTFDDIVLGLSDKIIGHQIKSSRDPESFNIRTLMLEAEKLLSKLVESWSKLKAEHPQKRVEVKFVTGNFPSTRDNIGGGDARS